MNFCNVHNPCKYGLKSTLNKDCKKNKDPFLLIFFNLPSPLVRAVRAHGHTSFLYGIYDKHNINLLKILKKIPQKFRFCSVLETSASGY